MWMSRRSPRLEEVAVTPAFPSSEKAGGVTGTFVGLSRISREVTRECPMAGQSAEAAYSADRWTRGEIGGSGVHRTEGRVRLHGRDNTLRGRRHAGGGAPPRAALARVGRVLGCRVVAGLLSARGVLDARRRGLPLRNRERSQRRGGVAPGRRAGGHRRASD